MVESGETMAIVPPEVGKMAIVSQDPLVKDLLLRLKMAPVLDTSQSSEGGGGGGKHSRASSLEQLREVVNVEKDMVRLIEAVQESKSLLLAKSWIGDDGLKLLMRALKEGSRHGSRLVHLDLADAGITAAGFNALTSAMDEGFLPVLEHLNVSQNRIGEAGADMLAKVLWTGSHSSLRGLDLSYCSIGDDGMVSFSEALQSGKFAALRLESLDFSANLFCERGAISFTRAIVMGRLPELKFLNLSSNKLGEHGTAAFGDVLKAGQLSGITHLILSRCELSNQLLPIAQAIEAGNLPNLQALDVSLNYMGDYGSKAFARAFRSGRTSKLQELILSECGIGRQQFHLIAEAIEVGGMRDLRYLDLSCNDLDSPDSSPSTSQSSIQDIPQGSVNLTTLIKRGFLGRLQYLNLSQCSIGDAGLMDLAELMEAGYLKRLQHFLCEGNEVTSKRSIKALVRALESGNLRQLTEMELGQNGVGEDVTMSLASALTLESLAQGPLVEKLKTRLTLSQKNSPRSTTVTQNLARFWRNKSFRGLEIIKLNESELKPREQIFNNYLKRQYSIRSPPVVHEEIAQPTTAKFILNSVVAVAWVVGILLTKRLVN